MIMALLKGKLSRKQENMEDLLTSCVFGNLRHLPPENALLPFLAEAETPEGAKPLADLPRGADVSYSFWPTFEEVGCSRCEPDVLITITAPYGKKILVFVEAKFRSGKSSEADDNDERPNDQLAKEWQNLARKASAVGAVPVLIYLTADVGCPREQIDASQRELSGKTGKTGNICWLSWRHLLKHVRGATRQAGKDLKELLVGLNLIFFEGFPGDYRCDPVKWHFSTGFRWPRAHVAPVDWRFHNDG